MKQKDFDELLQEDQQDHEAQESDGESDQNDEGFELNLGNIKADTNDFSFLTKFLTNFKKIKNVDMGQAKAS